MTKQTRRQAIQNQRQKDFTVRQKRRDLEAYMTLHFNDLMAKWMVPKS